MPLLSLEILVTCITYFKSIHPRSETPPLPRTLPLIIHIKKYPPSLLCTKVLSADCYYGPVADITAADCSHARLSQWAAGCLIHLCVLSAYQDQARGSHALESLNWTQQKTFHSLSVALGLNIPVTHAPTCFAALDGKGKLQALCKFSSQRSLWGKDILKSSFKKVFLFLMDLEAKKN